MYTMKIGVYYHIIFPFPFLLVKHGETVASQFCPPSNYFHLMKSHIYDNVSIMFHPTESTA